MDRSGFLAASLPLSSRRVATAAAFATHAEAANKKPQPKRRGLRLGRGLKQAAASRVVSTPSASRSTRQECAIPGWRARNSTTPAALQFALSPLFAAQLRPWPPTHRVGFSERQPADSFGAEKTFRVRILAFALPQGPASGPSVAERATAHTTRRVRKLRSIKFGNGGQRNRLRVDL